MGSWGSDILTLGHLAAGTLGTACGQADAMWGLNVTSLGLVAIITAILPLLDTKAQPLVTDAIEEKQIKNFIEQISGKSAEGDEKYLPSLLPQKGDVVMARNKSLTVSLQTSEDQSSEIIERNRRQVGPSSPSPLAEAEPTEELLVEEPKKGPSLGQILGVASLIILVLYIFGISWKLFKIHRGTYVEEEPVFY